MLLLRTISTSILTILRCKFRRIPFLFLILLFPFLLVEMCTRIMLWYNIWLRRLFQIVDLLFHNWVINFKSMHFALHLYKNLLEWFQTRMSLSCLRIFIHSTSRAYNTLTLLLMSLFFIPFNFIGAPKRARNCSMFTIVLNMMDKRIIWHISFASGALKFMLVNQHFEIFIQSPKVRHEFLFAAWTSILSLGQAFHTESTNYFSTIWTFSAFVDHMLT